MAKAGVGVCPFLVSNACSGVILREPADDDDSDGFLKKLMNIIRTGDPEGTTLMASPRVGGRFE